MTQYLRNERKKVKHRREKRTKHSMHGMAGWRSEKLHHNSEQFSIFCFCVFLLLLDFTFLGLRSSLFFFSPSANNLIATRAIPPAPSLSISLGRRCTFPEARMNKASASRQTSRNGFAHACDFIVCRTKSIRMKAKSKHGGAQFWTKSKVKVEKKPPRTLFVRAAKLPQENDSINTFRSMGIAHKSTHSVNDFFSFFSSPSPSSSSFRFAHTDKRLFHFQRGIRSPRRLLIFLCLFCFSSFAVSRLRVASIGCKSIAIACPQHKHTHAPPRTLERERRKAKEM